MKARVATCATFLVLAGVACAASSGDANVTPPPGAPAPTTPTMPTMAPPGAVDDDYDERLAALEAARVAAWAIPETNGGWEVVYDGTKSAADVVPPHLRWDSAVDDDYTECPDVSFQLDSPSAGFWTLDRTLTEEEFRARGADEACVERHFPVLANKTGNIWRRDEFITHARGFTLETRVKIFANSDPLGFQINYFDDFGSFAVTLGPDAIKGFNATGTDATADVTLAGAFHDVRVVKAANGTHVDVYLDGAKVLQGDVREGGGNGGIRVGDGEGRGKDDHTHPRVLVGDNFNTLGADGPTVRGHFTLDHVSYRRGVFPPSRPLETPSRRNDALPPLPVPATAPETWTGTFDGTQTPEEAGADPAGGLWTQLEGGVLELDNLGGTRRSDSHLDSPIGIRRRGAFTVEARLQVMPDSDPRGFVLNVSDSIGSGSLTFSPDKIEMFNGVTSVGFFPFAKDTTDGFHTYRLVRHADGMYVYLYVDDDPIPAIVDYHLSSGRSVDAPRVRFGNTLFPDRHARAHVKLDYIRWKGGADAPPRR